MDYLLRTGFEGGPIKVIGRRDSGSRERFRIALVIKGMEKEQMEYEGTEIMD